jgi:hypothetical protein
VKAALTSFILACSMIATLGNAVLALPSNAEKPRLDHASLFASPTVQGVGGTVNVQASVQVNGTC